MEKRELLAEYFSIGLNSDGELTSLPILLKGHQPNMEKLPLFMFRLGIKV